MSESKGEKEELEMLRLAIVRYEQTRQDVNSVKGKRSNLLKSCNRLSQRHAGDTCLQITYSEYEPDETGKMGFFEYLEELYVAGECCANCFDSYRMKVYDIPAANIAHGRAKTNLTVIGKNLMKSGPAE